MACADDLQRVAWRMPLTAHVLTTDQRAELEARVRSRRARADAVRRACVILQLAACETYAIITAATGCSSRTNALWKGWFEADGLAGLEPRRRGSRPAVHDPGPASAHSGLDEAQPPRTARRWSYPDPARRIA